MSDASPEQTSRRMKKILSQTVPDENMQIASSKDLIKTVEEFEEHSRKQHEIVTNILLDTLEDAVMEHQYLDFNVVALQETTRDSNKPGKILDDEVIQDRLQDKTVPGRYDINGLLGTGATGQVFEVHDNNFHRNIAVKFMHPEDAHNQKKLLRFIDEAAITARLAHPNILPIHDMDYTDGALIYFTMGRANGRSLHDLIDEAENNTELPQAIRSYDDRARIILQVCNAVAYAHSKGIVHNDVKPGNIMVGEFGEVLLVDWGTATTPEQRADSHKRMLGTPIYMSPEQANRDNPDERSDIYCLGSTLYHLLLMRFPCWHDDIETFWKFKREGIYQKATDAERRKAPGALLAIAEKAMAPKPENRYASVDAMIIDLEAYLQGQAVSVHQDSLWEIVKRLYKKDPRVIYAALTGLLVIIAAIGWLYYEKTLEYSRWRVKDHIDFNNASLSDISSTWDLTMLPGWRKPHAYALPIDNEHIKLENDALQFNKDVVSFGTANLTYKDRIPGHMRVRWEYTANHDRSNLNCYIGGPTRADSYMFHVGGFGQRDTVRLTKGPRTLASAQMHTEIIQGRRYHLEMEKTDTSVMLSIDGRRLIHFTDPDMLVGGEHQKFGFDLMHAGTVIDNVLIEYKPPAQKISPITVGHHYFSNGLYDEALLHYRKIKDVYPDTDMAIVALYRIGRCHAELGHHQDAAIYFKQFLKSYPEHELHDHVALQYAYSLSGQQKWPELQQTIERYDFRDSDILVRQSLFSSIESTFNDVIVGFPDEQTQQLNGANLYYLDRTFQELQQQILSSIEQTQAFSKRLGIPINHNTSSLYDRIADLAIGLLNDTSIIYEHYPADSHAVYNALIKDRDLEKLEAQYPDRRIHYLRRLERSTDILALVRSDQLNEKQLTELFYDGCPPELLTAFQQRLPDNRLVQAVALLKQGKYQQIIDEYKDQLWIYLQALDHKRRYRDILDIFEAHSDIFNKRWFKVRTLAKMRRFDLAKTYAGYGSQLYLQATCYEAVYSFIKGDRSAFDNLRQHELAKIEQKHLFLFTIPFLLHHQDGATAVRTACDKELAWFTERNHGSRAAAAMIDYICGKDLDAVTDLGMPPDFELFTGFRHELRGEIRKAKAAYRTASRRLEFNRSVIAKWRLRELNK